MRTIKRLLTGLIAAAAGILAYDIAFRVTAFFYSFLLSIPLLGRLFDILFNVLPGDLLILTVMGYFGCLASVFAMTFIIGISKTELTWPVKIVRIILCLLFVLSMLMYNDFSLWTILRTVIWIVEVFTIIRE